jgi:nucleoside-diphosphate-sugar epimerase
MDYTVALTGATGFIGNRVARRLVTNGCKLQALTRKTSDRSRLSGFNIHWVEGTLEDVDSLRRLVRGADAVVHCAGRQAETVLADQAGNMSWVVLRPPAVYGPGDKEMLPLWRWMARGFAFVLGSGKARFSMLYVDDLAAAIRKCLLNERLPNGVFELHDGHLEGYSWQNVIDTFAHLNAKSVGRIHMPVSVLRLLARLNLAASLAFGYAPMLTPGKVRELRHPNWVCDNNAFARATGWKPRVSLEAGLRRTLAL